MPNRLWIAAVLAVTPILAMSPIAFPPAHEAGCVRAALGARHVQRSFMSLMKRRDAEAGKQLDRYRLARVKSSAVKLISDAGICERAALAYGSVMRDSDTKRQVTLVKVGDRYVVSDPDFAPDRHKRSVTFDSTFTDPLALVVE